MTTLNYYIDGFNGDDANAGTTPATAKRTLANSSLFKTIPAAGDITYINFKRGTTISVTGNLAINNAAGTLVYQDYGDSADKPLLIYTGDWSWGCSATGANLGIITVKNLNINFNGATGGLFCYRNSIKFNVLDCTLQNAQTLLKISGNGYGKILRNTLQHVNSGNGAAIYGGQSVLDNYPGLGGYEIAYNTILNVNGQDGITLHDADTTVLASNWIHHNYIESGTENAMDIAAAEYRGTIITDNIFVGRKNGGTYIVSLSNTEPTSGLIFTRNIVDNSLGLNNYCAQFSGASNKVYSNIFISASPVSGASVLFGSSATSQEVYNNLFIAMSTAVREPVSMQASSTGTFKNNIVLTLCSGSRYIVNDLTSVGWVYGTNCVYGPNITGNQFYYNGAERNMAYWLASVSTTDQNTDPKLDGYQYTNSSLTAAGQALGFYLDKNAVYYKTTPAIGPFETKYNRAVRG